MTQQIVWVRLEMPRNQGLLHFKEREWSNWWVPAWSSAVPHGTYLFSPRSLIWQYLSFVLRQLSCVRNRLTNSLDMLFLQDDLLLLVKNDDIRRGILDRQLSVSRKDWKGVLPTFLNVLTWKMIMYIFPLT